MELENSAIFLGVRSDSPNIKQLVISSTEPDRAIGINSLSIVNPNITDNDNDALFAGFSWVLGVKCIQCYSLSIYEMDFHLDKLLNFPNATVESCSIAISYFQIRWLNEKIQCPICGETTTKLHQERQSLIRDLSGGELYI